MVNYLTREEIIEINKKVLERIKVKKSDKHEVKSNSSIDKAIDECEYYDGDYYDKAVQLLENMIKKHPFGSANRRTAFLAVKIFLRRNNYPLGVKNHGKESITLKGIREGYYSQVEIKKWLITGKIRKFERN